MSTRTLAQKLGLKPGCRVGLVGVTDAAALEAVSLAGAERVEPVPGAGLDFVLLQIGELGDLRGIPAARDAVATDGAVWVMWPKGGHELRQNEVQRAGLDAGLVDVKVASVSDRMSGLKFVYRLADR